MRFAFAGIDFLGDVFETLLDKGWQPVKLFSRQCDRIYDFNDATVARARSLKIPVQFSRLQPADLAGLSAMRCDALIVAGYPWLIKNWEPHLRYAVNFHPSPLPEGRGPYPLFRAILDAVPEWGMTAHAIDATFDTGAIVAQRIFPVAPDANHDLLLAKCQIAAKHIARDLADDLPRLWNAAKPQGAGSYWPRTTAAQRTVDWTRQCRRRAAHHPRLRVDRGLRTSRNPHAPRLGSVRLARGASARSPARSSTNTAATSSSPPPTVSCS